MWFERLSTPWDHHPCFPDSSFSKLIRTELQESNCDQIGIIVKTMNCTLENRYSILCSDSKEHLILGDKVDFIYDTDPGNLVAINTQSDPPSLHFFTMMFTRDRENRTWHIEGSGVIETFPYYELNKANRKFNELKGELKKRYRCVHKKTNKSHQSRAMIEWAILDVNQIEVKSYKYNEREIAFAHLERLQQAESKKLKLLLK
jgi:hypothetical protein